MEHDGDTVRNLDALKLATLQLIHQEAKGLRMDLAAAGVKADEVLAELKAARVAQENGTLALWVVGGGALIAIALFIAGLVGLLVLSLSL